jgi:hypothetical protein
MAWISDVAPPGTRAAALGIRLTANRASQATLPAAIAVVTTGSGATGVFLGAAVLLAVSSAPLARAPLARAPLARAPLEVVAEPGNN